MSLKRIDIIAQNGNDGQHYKYDEVAERLLENISEYVEFTYYPDGLKETTVKILVEAFPNDL